MTRCIKCHRPLKAPTPTGMGSTCASRYAQPVPAHERDLFGDDTLRGQAVDVAEFAKPIPSNPGELDGWIEWFPS